MNKPGVIRGGIYSDYRGSLRFVNDFVMTDVVRFYAIRHLTTDFVRAWQGHKKEKKFFYPLSGSFIIAWVKPDNFENPSKKLKASCKILSKEASEILFIPEGYANGIKALEPDSEIMVFSTLSLGESKNDDYRFPSGWWFDWDKY